MKLNCRKWSANVQRNIENHTTNVLFVNITQIKGLWWNCNFWGYGRKVSKHLPPLFVERSSNVLKFEFLNQFSSLFFRLQWNYFFSRWFVFQSACWSLKSDEKIVDCENWKFRQKFTSLSHSKWCIVIKWNVITHLLDCIRQFWIVNYSRAVIQPVNNLFLHQKLIHSVGPISTFIICIFI